MKKLNPLHFIFIGICVILLLITSILGGIFLRQNKPKIAFYNVNPQIQQVVLNSLNQEFRKGKKSFEALSLDNTQPLSSQKKNLKRCTLLIAQNDMDVMEFCNNSALTKDISGDILKDMPSSFVDRISYLNAKSLKTVPFLYDFYEIDVNFPIYQKVNADSINSWSDYLDFCEKAQKAGYTSINLNGQNSVAFLDAVGMISEAIVSQEIYSQILTKLYDAYKKSSVFDFSQKTALEVYLNEITDEKHFKDNPKEPSLYPAIYELKKLYKNGILPQNFENTDKEAFYIQLNKSLCGSAFLKLSEHRKIDYSAIKNYKSIYCPSVDYTSSRKFSAPEYVVSIIKDNKNSSNMINWLCVSDQTKISTEAGLSPVQKNCVVADHQADDVRYWLAASQGPCFPLSAAFPSEESKKQAYIILLKKIVE